MYTNINNYAPIRPWFDAPDDEEQWECGYRDEKIAQFKQDLNNKNLTLQDQGKDDPIDTLENRIKFWINIISNARGPEPDSLYDYDYNDEGLDETVRGWERREFPERRDLKKFLDKHRSKGLRKTLKLYKNENYLKPLKKIMLQTKQMFITSMTSGV